MICRLCGAEFAENSTCRPWYDQVAFYTLSHPDQAYFIHQLVVDAYGAQHATEASKSIAVAFALLGLYLFSEKGYTGKQVQMVHVQLGKVKSEYPKFDLPKNRGAINIQHVLGAAPGPERDQKIKEWVLDTWKAFRKNRFRLIDILVKNKIIN